MPTDKRKPQKPQHSIPPGSITLNKSNKSNPAKTTGPVEPVSSSSASVTPPASGTDDQHNSATQGPVPQTPPVSATDDISDQSDRKTGGSSNQNAPVQTAPAPTNPQPLDFQSSQNQQGQTGQISQKSAQRGFPRGSSAFPSPAPMNNPTGGGSSGAWDDWGGGGNDFGYDDPFGSGGMGGGGFGGSGYGGMGMGDYGSGGFGQRPAQGSTQKRLTPEERVQMIEKVYDEILCRKPDTRDINYYKYSTLGEDQIRKQLITSAEHKDMMKKGREYADLKDRSEQLETRVRMLEGQIKDQLEEFKELSNLLREKNQLIAQCRNQLTQRVQAEMSQRGQRYSASVTQGIPAPVHPTEPATTPAPTQNIHETVASVPDPNQPDSETESRTPTEEPNEPVQPSRDPIFTTGNSPVAPDEFAPDIQAKNNQVSSRFMEILKSILSRFF
ncbi:MAG: hypothetical protein PHG63_03635 [Candidatus Dojkabacteria bacterium]|nr:hypothetical protein [Candidatus Dojkabacteria bacterium]